MKVLFDHSRKEKWFRDYSAGLGLRRPGFEYLLDYGNYLGEVELAKLFLKCLVYLESPIKVAIS